MFDVPLNGMLFFIFLAAVPVAFGLSLVVRPLYRRAVLRAMQRQSAVSGADFALPAGLRAETRRLSITMPVTAPRTRRRYALGLRYLCAGLVHGIAATLVYFFLEGIDFALRRVLIVWMILSWPALPLALHVAGFNRWVVLAAAMAAAGVLYLVEPDSLFLIAWLVGPAAVAALVIANRLFRTTALMLYLIAIALILPLLFALDLALQLVMVAGSAALVLSIAIMLGVGMVFAYGLVRLIGVSGNRASDLMVQSDVLWLMVSLWQVTQLSGSHGAGAVLALLPLLAYRAMLFAVSVLRLRRPPRLLLFLRVFGQQKNQEKLSFGLLTDWRLRGPVMLIGAADLATETLNPSELAAFLNFSTEDLFIKCPQDLEAAISALPVPAHDGLFAMVDYYCKDNTWRPTVISLMNLADHVILDLRGFTSENSGVQFEIAELVRRVDPAHIDVLVDDTTDKTLARSAFEREWKGIHGGGAQGVAEIAFQPV